jgi:nitrite reductase (NADH) large subunit
VICVDSGYDIVFAGAAGLDIKGTQALCHAESEEETIEIIAALVQLYREQGRYLERVYKWAKRIGVVSIKAQVVDDLAKRRGLFDRFVFSQSFAQNDPWRERVAGRDAHEFTPIADLALAAE